MTTEIELFQKLSDALNELKKASALAAKLTPQERTHLRTQTEMNQLQEALSSCYVSVEPALTKMFRQIIERSEQFALQFASATTSAKIAALQKKIMAHPVQLPSLDA